MEDTDIDFADGDIILDGEIINDKIRTPEISKAASLYSAIPEVRRSWWRSSAKWECARV